MTDRVKDAANALYDRFGGKGSLVVACINRDAAKSESHREFYADVVAYIEAALASRND
jgi:hypothetical protein